MTVKTLHPSLAADAAQFSYFARRATPTTIGNMVPDSLEPEFDFSGNLISGVSGTVFERLFNHRTGFGVIGQGRAKSAYRGHHLVAMRGTALGRDAVTDMHCGVSAAPNNKPSHVGFNRTFNSMLPALHSYFDKAPQGPVHCVGHSLGGALANLTANWLRATYHVPVNLYTFGAPRVGRRAYSSHTEAEVSNIYRCTHGADPVPMVPVWPFIHAGNDYRLDGENGINPAAHNMDKYANSASRFRDYQQMNCYSALNQIDTVRLRYQDRNLVSFSAYWQHRIGNALLTLLKDAGQLTSVVTQVATMGTLTAYDFIAYRIEEIARMSTAYADQTRGLLGCMLNFVGKRTVNVTELNYKFIRWVLRITLEKLFKSAKMAIEIGGATAW